MLISSANRSHHCCFHREISIARFDCFCRTFRCWYRFGGARMEKEKLFLVSVRGRSGVFWRRPVCAGHNGGNEKGRNDLRAGPQNQKWAGRIRPDMWHKAAANPLVALFRAIRRHAVCHSIKLGRPGGTAVGGRSVWRRDSYPFETRGGIEKGPLTLQLPRAIATSY